MSFWLSLLLPLLDRRWIGIAKDELLLIPITWALFSIFDTSLARWATKITLSILSAVECIAE
jgi:hypothetical protein